VAAGSGARIAFRQSGVLGFWHVGFKRRSIEEETSMNMPDLKVRLDQLAEHLQRAEAHLKRGNIFSADHKLKALELQARYEALSRKVHAEITEAEAQGHHVSDLERSVREWLDSLELDMD